MKDNSQQSKPFYIRDGFPISPKRVNDVFDAMLYDFYTMLSQDLAELGTSNEYYIVLEQLAKIEGLTKQDSNKKIEYIQNEHTSNWRHL